MAKDGVKASQGGKAAEVPVEEWNPFGGPPLKPETYREDGSDGTGKQKSFWKLLIEGFTSRGGSTERTPR